MEYIELTIDRLQIDPTNYRGHYDNIEELAESINRHGLLQNLVVVPPEEGSSKYTVRAGNRRTLAILHLQELGKWPPEEPIMCLVRDDDPWIALVENMNRREVAPWRIGYRYLEMVEAGISGRDLAAQLGCSNGTVSNYCRIARGLHPDIIKKMDRIGHTALAKAQYLAISACQDEWGAPHLQQQERLLTKLLEARTSKIAKAPRRRSLEDLTPAERVYRRLRNIQSGNIQIPGYAMLFVMPILDYLIEGKRVKFPPPLKGDIDD